MKNIRHLLNRVNNKAKYAIEEKRKLQNKIIKGLLIFNVITICLAFNNNIAIREYEAFSDKITSNTQIRIAVLADLHSCIYGENQNVLIDKIKEQKPDLITLVGDIADDEEPILGTEIFLEKIKDFASVYYVTGNHEFWSNDAGNIVKTIRYYGVKVLQNEQDSISINGIELTICGIDDPYVFKYTNDEEFLNMASEGSVN